MINTPASCPPWLQKVRFSGTLSTTGWMSQIHLSIRMQICSLYTASSQMLESALKGLESAPKRVIVVAPLLLRYLQRNAIKVIVCPLSGRVQRRLFARQVRLNLPDSFSSDTSTCSSAVPGQLPSAFVTLAPAWDMK